MKYAASNFWRAGAVLLLLGGVAGAVRAAGTDELERRIDVLSREIEELKTMGRGASGTEYGAVQKTRVGGYMELHYLSTQKGDGENFDFHRYVLYVGHRFSDWIQFHSELEFEHGFINDRQGEFELEQAYIDFKPKEDFGIRAGVIVAPMGVINQFHEPPTFHGVERPDVDNKIIPSTWFAAGAGVYGSLTPNLKYQIYGINALQFVSGGRDGTKATGLGAQLGTDGIRNLRQKQFGGEQNGDVLDIGIAARLDYAVERYPLNLGFSYYGGAADDKVLDTAGNPELTGLVFDARYRQDRLDFAGEWAQFDVDDADKLKSAYGADQAARLEGWYAQGAYWLLQPGDRNGLLADAGLAGFVRYEKFDTAKKMPANATDRAQNNRDRTQWVYGIPFKPVANLAVKLDYTSFNDADGTTFDSDKLNAGIGWQF
ncbi:MAG: hypothetical protein A3I06_06555 [Candidatus Lindowbacteria bacterium RIFCSPLOWO2_02_FULL_62_12]|nr:MAG: hypothetical protein A3I06_06555 [Candidatus Lindowbacteria bacterium RIFCSPLOWO2_02_FULL_62_12]